MLRVMISDNDLERTKPLKQSLIDTDSPNRDTLENICVMTMHDPRSIMMFTHDDKEQKTLATKAGVRAYVVGGIPNERLRPVIDAAVARFEEFKHLREALNEANTKFSERYVI